MDGLDGAVGAGRARWELDRGLGLVTFEVWVRDRRVFGIDDGVGPSSG